MADLQGAVAAWRRRSAHGDQVPPSLSWVRSPADPSPAVEEVVERAVATLDERAPFVPMAGGSPIAIVSKRPHGCSRTALVSILGRCAMFGLDLHHFCSMPAREAGRIAQTLYSDAWVYYQAPPRNEALWEALTEVFSAPEFRTIFGSPFHRSMVKPAAVVIAETGVDAEALGEIWQEGRTPIGRAALTGRYGAAAAALVLDGREEYSWYRGRWPIGVQRIAPSLFAFALRHERLYDGAPIVMLNGHFLLLSSLFANPAGGESSSVTIARLPDAGSSVADIRHWVIGAQDDPAECEIGTIRHDAWSGDFPIDTDMEVTPWANVVHCSDGYLAGVIETARLLDVEPQGSLHTGLVNAGYDTDELREIVFSDPVVPGEAGPGHLTTQTKGLSLDDTVRVIRSFFPPTFGRANGFGGGLSVGTFLSAQQRLLSDPTPGRLDGTVSRRPLTVPAVDRTSLDELVPLGVKAISAGRVAVSVPAAGTGGRFGGYHLPEGHPDRSKALLPLFEVGGHRLSALDIRMANVRHWRSRGGPVPVGITTAAANRSGVERWLRRLPAAETDVRLLDQVGTFRWSLKKLLEGPTVGLDAIAGDDFVLRDPEGSPLLKPAGSLGLLAALLFSGTLDNWESAGVRYIFLANSDDVGARIEPSIIGLMEADASLDAVVVCLPTPFVGTLADGTGVWCDQSGWAFSAAGASLDLVHFTESKTGAVARFRGQKSVVPVEKPTGGWLQESEVGPNRWSVTVSERDPVQGASLFSTNQMYLQLRSIQQLIAGPANDPIALRALRDRLPLYAEHKRVVPPGGEPLEAVQVFQPIACVLEALSRVVPVTIDRRRPSGQRTAYVPLKQRDDVAIAQAYLRSMADNDDLVLPDSSDEA